MDADELRERLAAGRLTRVGAGIVALAAPTVWVHVTPAAEEAIAVGASKVGGLPDLPAGVGWPAWHEPMAFLAQFDLGAVAPFDVEGALPPSGLLSFFYETDGEPLYAQLWGKPDPERKEDYPVGSDPRAWRVLYVPDAGQLDELERCPWPADGGPLMRYPTCAVRFSTELTIPDPDAPEVVALELSEAERRAYINLSYDERSPNRGVWPDPGNRLLGHPFTLGHGTSLAECDFDARARPGQLWSGVSDEERQAIEREAAARWRLLLQLDSSEPTGMDWAGGGVLHFCIERAALAGRDFTGVWLNMQFV